MLRGHGQQGLVLDLVHVHQPVMGAVDDFRNIRRGVNLNNPGYLACVIRINADDPRMGFLGSHQECIEHVWHFGVPGVFHLTRNFLHAVIS